MGRNRRSPVGYPISENEGYGADVFACTTDASAMRPDQVDAFWRDALRVSALVQVLPIPVGVPFRYNGSED
jgi:hypothetical protein